MVLWCGVWRAQQTLYYPRKSKKSWMPQIADWSLIQAKSQSLLAVCRAVAGQLQTNLPAQFETFLCLQNSLWDIVARVVTVH